MSAEFRAAPDIAALVAALARYRVDFVVFGSIGAVAYGAALSPGDFDVCPDPEPANLARLTAMLAEVDARPRVMEGWMTAEASAAWKPDPRAVETFDHLFTTAHGAFDVVPRPFGPTGDADRFTFAGLAARAATLAAFGGVVRVAQLDDQIASKMSRRREKDRRAETELLRLKRMHHEALKENARWTT